MLEIRAWRTPCRTRLPFRSGAVTLDEVDLCTVRARVEVEGAGLVDGLASDLLLPGWLEGDPESCSGDDVQALLASLTAGARSFLAAGDARTPFDAWWRAYGTTPASPGGSLVRGFGLALVERALIDAACRAAGVSFFEALRGDLLGFEPARIRPELGAWSLPESLAGAPLDTLNVRHTVGLSDALRDTDVPRGARVADGLPQSLEAAVRTHGLTHFKLALAGEPQADAARLIAIARVLAELVTAPLRVTVDAREQYRCMSDLVETLDRTRRDRDGRALLDGLVAVEQPIARQASFERAALDGIAELDARAPVIIDAADADPDALPRALDCGYRGVSVRSCKGVFRTLASRGVCELVPGAIQSAEAMSSLPLLALQQDLTTVAALGLTHVELNGHQRFRGLDHLPGSDVQEALRAHPDLYVAADDGARLHIEDGRLRVGSLQQRGYGYAAAIDVDAREPLATWRAA